MDLYASQRRHGGYALLCRVGGIPAGHVRTRRERGEEVGRVDARDPGGPLRTPE